MNLSRTERRIQRRKHKTQGVVSCVKCHVFAEERHCATCGITFCEECFSDTSVVCCFLCEAFWCDEICKNDDPHKFECTTCALLLCTKEKHKDHMNTCDHLECENKIETGVFLCFCEEYLCNSCIK